MRNWLMAGALFAVIGVNPAAAQQSTPQASVTLDHVAIWVADQGKSVEFYQALFGLKETPAPFPPGGPRWFLFGNGVELHIQPNRKEAIAMPRRVHFAVNVPSLDPVIAQLKARGMTWTNVEGTVGAINRNRTDGVQQIFLQDPDGYWIEVNDVPVKK